MDTQASENSHLLVVDLRPQPAQLPKGLRDVQWPLFVVNDLAHALDELVNRPTSCMVMLCGTQDRLTERVLAEATRSRGVPLVRLDKPERDAEGICEVSPSADACMNDRPAVITRIEDAIAAADPGAGQRQTRAALASLRQVLEDAADHIRALELATDAPTIEAPSLPLDHLSAREREVLDVLLSGATNKEIAAQLGVSPHTVGNHLRAVYRKLEVNSRAELLARFCGR